MNFQEIDQARWFSLIEAGEFINEKQRAFLEELEDVLDG